MADANKIDKTKANVNITDEEQKTIEQFAGQLQEIPVPGSLRPDQIKKMLGEKCQKKKAWWKNKRVYGSLAAAIVLVAGLGIYGMQSKETKPVTVTKDVQTAKS